MKRRVLLRGFSFAIGLALVWCLVSMSSRKTEALAVKTVIVQLSKEPVVVAKYRAGLEGQSFDPAAYKQQVIAEQDSFLQRVSAAGIAYTVAGVSAPNGPVTADIKFRFNYVYNGVTLVVPDTAIPLLRNIEGVTGVYEAQEMRPVLDRAVNYIRAPQLYGNPAKLTQFDQLNSGGAHGEGMIVAVIDTGIDWTHVMGLLDEALDHLTLGRAALHEAILEHSDLRLLTSDFFHIDFAMDGLRRANSQDHVPRGLLTRAWLRSQERKHIGHESAEEDLDEAWDIAERGPMRLHMADIHLYRARLFHAVEPYPWNKFPDGAEGRGPKDDLKDARTLIEKCGYWRRKDELEDAEEAAKNWD